MTDPRPYDEFDRDPHPRPAPNGALVYGLLAWLAIIACLSGWGLYALLT